MKIGVLANKDSWYWRDIHRAATEIGHVAVRGEFSTISSCIGSREDFVSTRLPRNGSRRRTDNECLSDCDVVIVRTMPPGSLEQVVFRMDALENLRARGIRVVNSPKAIECAVDKFLTSARLHLAGLNIPRTITCQDSESALEAFDSLGQDVVVKPLFGSEGRGIIRVTDPDIAFRTFRTLERIEAVLYLQEFVHHPGFDVRILTLGGRIVGGMKRLADNDFRTNVSRDARAERHEPSDVECALALQAAEVAGCFIAGVDLLYDNDGNCFVIEVNAVPGWMAFNKVNSTDVAVDLIKALTQ